MNATKITQGLPKLNEFGFLPAGTYEASLKEVEEVFAKASLSRETQWKQFLRFVDWIKGMEAFDAIEIGGSYLTSVSEPSDIDVALVLRRVSVPVMSASALLTNEMTKQIKDEYGVQVLVKKLNSEPYKANVHPDFSFASNRLPLFRVLKKEARQRIAQAEKRYVGHNEELRGVIRIDFLKPSERVNTKSLPGSIREHAT